jgi:hypothetical protein
MDNIIGNPQPRRWGARVEYTAVRTMLLEGWTPAQMHDRNKMISEDFFRRLLSHWRLHEELPYETRIWASNFKTVQQGMAPGVVLVLKDLALTHPDWYLYEYCKWLFNHGHGSYHPSTVSRQLHKQGLSLAVLDDIARQRDAEERARFLDEIHSVKYVEQFVCIDETQRDRNASRRRRGWGTKGKIHSLVRRWHGYRHDLLYTMIGAVDVNGFIPECCQLVAKPETVNAAKFTQYIQEYICPVIGNYLEGEPRSVVTMDNATVHNPLVVEALINDAGGRVIWTPRYSPDLHPIETCFHQYKACLKRLHHEDAYLDVFKAHQDAMNSVSRENMLNYFSSQWGTQTQNYTESEDLLLLAVLLLDDD